MRNLIAAFGISIGLSYLGSAAAWADSAADAFKDHVDKLITMSRDWVQNETLTTEQTGQIELYSRGQSAISLVTSVGDQLREIIEKLGDPSAILETCPRVSTGELDGATIAVRFELLTEILNQLPQARLYLGRYEIARQGFAQACDRSFEEYTYDFSVLSRLAPQIELMDGTQMELTDPVSMLIQAGISIWHMIENGDEAAQISEQLTRLNRSLPSGNEVIKIAKTSCAQSQNVFAPGWDRMDTVRDQLKLTLNQLEEKKLKAASENLFACYETEANTRYEIWLSQLRQSIHDQLAPAQNATRLKVRAANAAQRINQLLALLRSKSCSSGAGFEEELRSLLSEVSLFQLPITPGFVDHALTELDVRSKACALLPMGGAS